MLWQKSTVNETSFEVLSIDASGFASVNGAGSWYVNDYVGKFEISGRHTSMEDGKKMAAASLLLFVLIRLLAMFSKEEILQMLDSVTINSENQTFVEGDENDVVF